MNKPSLCCCPSCICDLDLDLYGAGGVLCRMCAFGQHLGPLRHELSSVCSCQPTPIEDWATGGVIYVHKRTADGP